MTQKKHYQPADHPSTYSLNQLVEKIDHLRKADPFDLSLEQDLVFAIMNLVSIEEHLVFSFNKTGKDKYILLLKQAREMRKTLLKQIIKEYEWEVWCTCKHLLATSMRLMEVGTKQLGAWHTDQAKQFFSQSYEMYTMFWGLVLDLVGAGKQEKKTDWQQWRDPLLGNVIDCCKE